MNATALIAEDEPLLAAGLQAELKRLWPELSVLATVGDGAAAVRAALEQPPRVCFLDIRMPGLSGLEAAQALAEEWPAGATGAQGDAPFPLLVFVTAYDQYALAAFDAQAVDYLVKPVDPQRLAACVQRLQQRLAAEASPGPAAAPPGTAMSGAAVSGAAMPGAAPSETAQAPGLEQAMQQLRALLGAAGPAAGSQPRLAVIQASVGNTVHMVPVDEVLYFEAADKYLRVVTAEREHLIRLSLRELLPQLDAGVFWQVHRSLVVRATAITTAVREDTGKVTLMLRGRPEKLTASRLYAHLFKGM